MVRLRLRLGLRLGGEIRVSIAMPIIEDKAVAAGGHFVGVRIRVRVRISMAEVVHARVSD